MKQTILLPGIDSMNILNLGAGVQSTCLYLMAVDNDLDMADYPVDYAIFADTGDEPQSVYRHIEWMKGLGGPPILVRRLLDDGTTLGDMLIRCENSARQRVASIPAYTRAPGQASVGMTRRQCTREWKVDVVERTIRRELFGLKPKQRIPKDAKVVQYMGFSADEPGRAARVRGRFDLKGWASVRFPLIDMLYQRCDCENWLRERVPHEVEKSACLYCPYKSNREWQRLKETDTVGWSRACEVDEGLRKADAPAARGMTQELFVHRSGRPLREANLDADQGQFDFMQECEGGCGL